MAVAPVDVPAPKKMSLWQYNHRTGPFQGHPFLQERITKYVAFLDFRCHKLSVIVVFPNHAYSNGVIMA